MICVPANRIFTYNVCLNVLSQLPTLLTSEPASLRLAEDHCPAVSQCLTHLQNSLLPPVVAVLVNTEVVLWALLFLQQQPKTQMSHINTGKHPPVTRLFVLWWLPAAEQTPAPTFLPNCSSGQTDRLILKPIQQDEHDQHTPSYAHDCIFRFWSMSKQKCKYCIYTYLEDWLLCVVVILDWAWTHSAWVLSSIY